MTDEPAHAELGRHVHPESHVTDADSTALVTRFPAERAAALIQARKTFRRWLGEGYDTDALNLVLATAAVEQLGGDPLWTLLVSGPGNAKTETVQSVQRLPRTHVVSTITSPVPALCHRQA